MKKSFTVLLFMVFLSTVTAQIAINDVYMTNKGPLNIQPLVHASMVLEWQHNTLYIDPSRIEKLNHGEAKADVVFITDIHGDHLNLKSLQNVITPKTIIVLPLAAQHKLKPANLPNKLIIIRNSETKKVKGIKVTAVAMYNLPDDATSRHKKGRGNGYVLDFGGMRVYISGDTEDIVEMRQLKNIDIAFVCMNLPYTMTVKQAVSAVLDFKPKIVYPYHYRGKNGLSDIAQFRQLILAKNADINVILTEWYPKQ